MANLDERVMENYAHAGNLKSRIDIYRYRTPRYDPVEVAVALLPQDGLGLVLDVGAGIGRYTHRLREAHPEAEVVAIDRAPGMLAEVEPPVMVADAQSLPYPDDCADALLAMHMLYHVPDIPKALGEFRRVLKPEGVLLASTNLDTDMAELADLWDRAARGTIGPDAFGFHTAVASFTSATAPALLGAVFGSVEEVEKEGVVRVPEPGPLLAYFGSLRNWVDCADEDFEAFMKAATNLSVDHFAKHETFDFTKTTVFYRCLGSAR